MKKKLLFVMNNLNCGGAEKALISLLEVMDFSKYEVDLFLFKQEGMFLDKVPKEVSLSKEPNKYKYFDMPFKLVARDCVRRGDLKTPFIRFRYSLKGKYSKTESMVKHRAWKHISKVIDHVEEEYDAAIGFMEQNPIYFIVDKVKANKKIGWIHNDYNKLDTDPEFDTSYFDQLNHIVTVSGECEKALHRTFPKHKEKVSVIYNIVSPKVIHHLSAERSEYDSDQAGEAINIVSIGRLHAQKNFELAILSCKELVTRGYNIRWRVIGEGDERKYLTELIHANGLQNHFELLGLRPNPYPYMRHADLYVQTSKYEGKSIAIDEAKILEKPIVVTNFSTARDQMDDGINGLIVEMNAASIADGIEKIITDSHLRNTLISNLSKEKLGTEVEVHKFYELLG